MSDQIIGPEHAMYGIRLMIKKGRDLGYLVKIERRHINYTQWFGFALYGGQAEALIAARVWRDAQTRQHKPLTKQEFVSQIRCNNTTGAAGVIRTTRRSKKRSGQFWSADYWIARPPRGIKVSTCYFSISRYGEEGAKTLAIQARRAMEALCSGYHAPHVPLPFQLGAAEEAPVSDLAKDRAANRQAID